MVVLFSLFSKKFGRQRICCLPGWICQCFCRLRKPRATQVEGLVAAIPIFCRPNRHIVMFLSFEDFRHDSTAHRKFHFFAKKEVFFIKNATKFDIFRKECYNATCVFLRMKRMPAFADKKRGKL